ncbi:hypothetical protein CFBP8129_38290 [Xanthomonas hortorum pv. gardneri]|uniref:Uncharacterized protein n=1 Tax=Xanthomonas hortorum pv. gardneri TaxID=2754056 RepID=A0A6V7EP55_9XANT|nr:hypothetical protein NCPPB940_06610 [Xanthomonas hortorum pv. taraxaci]CAD0352484.1 hypothetical protein CFBP2044_37770 [Xanthomonas hortorum pv. cynarae]CAD0353057.1 hypothetical protein CFBP8129_38290 [Xanthomonas hortorum pv. gardneri]CAH2706856.1 hypothetical protein NCPPB1935_03585 [Xanthomonas campestris pv. nigromaculans]CAD0305745.1 hypothetical protein NCPPB940_06610 [Xanthomonas hortorum pv. taraxaci]
MKLSRERPSRVAHSYAGVHLTTATADQSAVTDQAATPAFANPHSPIPASRRLAACLRTRIGDQGFEQYAIGMTGDGDGTERDRLDA